MEKMVNIYRKLFNRRKHQRFMVRSGTVVIVTPETDTNRKMKVQVVDVSMGGAAFIYQGTAADLEKSGFLKICADTPDSESVKFSTASDSPAPGSTATSTLFRRRGVKFTWMGVLGKAELKDFIKEAGVCHI